MSLPAKAPAAAIEPEPDQHVVERVLGGDVAAFELLMRRYNQRLFRVARSIVGDDAEAEDVVQQAYLSAYQHLDQFAGRSQFSTWLTRIAVYEAAARRRAQHRLVSAADIDAMQFKPAKPNAADEASRRELGQVLAAAVDALPEELRAVVALRMIENLSTAETAECLELTPANVKTRLHRARVLLRSWIDARIGQEARQLYAFDGARCDRIVERVLSRLAEG